ncbi:MAG: hypothetical protein NC092_05910 [Butyrivibrio sp.]|nr:hypothetical protein [Muribaculum sp.]MCM1552211.1 hypothetical protein [Butyrivibrio sp.]
MAVPLAPPLIEQLSSALSVTVCIVLFVPALSVTALTVPFAAVRIVLFAAALSVTVLTVPFAGLNLLCLHSPSVTLHAKLIDYP